MHDQFICSSYSSSNILLLLMIQTSNPVVIPRIVLLFGLYLTTLLLVYLSLTFKFHDFGMRIASIYRNHVLITFTPSNPRPALSGVISCPPGNNYLWQVSTEESSPGRCFTEPHVVVHITGNIAAHDYLLHYF